MPTSGATRRGRRARPSGPCRSSLRWWDHWLKGRDTGIMEEPMLRAFLQQDLPAAPWYAEAPGRWVGEATWPSPRIAPKALHLNADGLGETAAAARALVNASPQTCGLAGGEWCPYGTGGSGPEFPGDQRFDDGASLFFDSPPLEAPLEILGAPVVELELAVDRPNAFVAVRLNDVKPDGAVGARHLRRAQPHPPRRPRDTYRHDPGQRTQVRVQLNDTAYCFQAGHRIPGQRLHHLLAADLAVAGGGHPDPLRRRRHRLSARQARRRRHPADLRRSGTGATHGGHPDRGAAHQQQRHPRPRQRPSRGHGRARQRSHPHRGARPGGRFPQLPGAHGHQRRRPPVGGNRDALREPPRARRLPRPRRRPNPPARQQGGVPAGRPTRHVWEGDEQILSKSWNCPIPRQLV